MAELSRRSGVPIPSIRYYIREGMLAAGELTSPNQGVYNAEHVRRLKLIRALLEVGGLSVAAARAVLANLDSPDTDELASLGGVQFALSTRRGAADDEAARAAAEDVEKLLARHGWGSCADNPARAELVDVLAVLHRLGQDDLLGALDTYAETAQRLAAKEVELVGDRAGLEERAEGVVVVSVLGDALLAALRRLAQETLLRRRLGRPTGG
jgi:DNA-binding transcriptional MerR regulator